MISFTNINRLNQFFFFENKHLSLVTPDPIGNVNKLSKFCRSAEQQCVLMLKGDYHCQYNYVHSSEKKNFFVEKDS